jgi:hypothetical protein
MNRETTNQAYRTPVLQDLGSVAERTLGAIPGDEVDPDTTAEFPLYQKM